MPCSCLSVWTSHYVFYLDIHVFTARWKVADPVCTAVVVVVVLEVVLVVVAPIIIYIIVRYTP